VKDKRTKNNNLEFRIGWCELEQDYVRKTTETLQDQTDRRRITFEKNAQRTDIDEVMGVGGSDDDEESESEDEDDDREGTGLPDNRSETKRRNQLLLQNWYSDRTTSQTVVMLL